MLKLDAANKSLEVVLGVAVTTGQLPVVCAYVDVDQATFAMTAASGTEGQTNSTTPVVIAAAPAAGSTRKIDFISVVNDDTVVATVTLQVNVGGVRRHILTVDLDPGDNLSFTG